MSRFRLVVMVVMLAGVLATSATAATVLTESKILKSRLYERLDQAWKQKRANGLRAIINGGETYHFEDKQIFIYWARKNYTLSVERNPRIGILYGDVMAEIGDAYMKTRKDVEYYKAMMTGASVFFSSQLIAYEDIARCEDKSAGKSYAAQWQSGRTLKAYKDFLKRQTDEDKLALWNSVKQLADTRNLMRPDREACASGADAIARAQMSKSCDTSDGCNPVDFVELIPDEKWMPLREKVQGVIKTRILEGKL